MTKSLSRCINCSDGEAKKITLDGVLMSRCIFAHPGVNGVVVIVDPEKYEENVIDFIMLRGDVKIGW